METTGMPPKTLAAMLFQDVRPPLHLLTNPFLSAMLLMWQVRREKSLHSSSPSIQFFLPFLTSSVLKGQHPVATSCLSIPHPQLKVIHVQQATNCNVSLSFILYSYAQTEDAGFEFKGNRQTCILETDLMTASNKTQPFSSQQETQ